MRRAGFSATTRQGIKNTSSPAGNVGERARRRPSQRGFRSGLSAPSTPWLHSGRIVGRSDRPSSIVAPNRNITKKKSATSIGGRSRPGRVEQIKMRRAGFSATTRQGIKNTISPAGNVGERARRRPSQRGFRSGLSAPSTPWLPAAASSVAPIARAPSSPRTGISLKGIRRRRRHHHRRPRGPGRLEQAKCAAPDSRPPPAKG